MFKLKEQQKKVEEYSKGKMIFDVVKSFVIPKRLKDIKSHTLQILSGVLFFFGILLISVVKLVENYKLLSVFLPSVFVTVVTLLLVKLKKIK